MIGKIVKYRGVLYSIVEIDILETWSGYLVSTTYHLIKVKILEDILNNSKGLIKSKILDKCKNKVCQKVNEPLPFEIISGENEFKIKTQTFVKIKRKEVENYENYNGNG